MSQSNQRSVRTFFENIFKNVLNWTTFIPYKNVNIHENLYFDILWKQGKSAFIIWTALNYFLQNLLDSPVQIFNY